MAEARINHTIFDQEKLGCLGKDQQRLERQFYLQLDKAQIQNILPLFLSFTNKTRNTFSSVAYWKALFSTRVLGWEYRGRKRLVNMGKCSKESPVSISSLQVYFFSLLCFPKACVFSLFMHDDFFCPLPYSAYATAFSFLCFILSPLKPFTSSKCVASASRRKSTTTGEKRTQLVLQRTRLQSHSQTWVHISGYERKADERLVRFFGLLHC